MVNSKLFLALTLASTGAIAAPSGPCNASYNACRTAPGANMAVCAAEHEACLLGLSKRDVADCVDTYNECRSAPGANMSTCESEKLQCQHANIDYTNTKPTNSASASSANETNASTDTNTEAASGPVETSSSSSSLSSPSSPSSSGNPSSATPQATATDTSAASHVGVSGSILAALIVALGLF